MYNSKRCNCPASLTYAGSGRILSHSAEAGHRQPFNPLVMKSIFALGSTLALGLALWSASPALAQKTTVKAKNDKVKTKTTNAAVSCAAQSKYVRFHQSVSLGNSMMSGATPPSFIAITRLVKWGYVEAQHALLKTV